MAQDLDDPLHVTAASDFSGQVVLVTGGGRGIERAISVAFARRGAHVIVNYLHSENRARATVAVITAADGSAEPLRASVGRRDTVPAMFATVRDRHGGLDVWSTTPATGC